MLASSTRMLRNAKRNVATRGGRQPDPATPKRQSQDREDKAGPDDSHIPQGPQPQHGFGSQVFRVNIDIRPSLGKQNGREVSPPVLDDLLFITVRRWYGVRHPHLPWRFLPVTVPLLGVRVFSREWVKAAAPLFLLGQLRQDLHYGRSVRFRPGLPG